MHPKVEDLLDRYYPRLEDGIRKHDGTKAFYQWIRATPGFAYAKVLNLGAGPTPEPGMRRLRGEVAHLVGVDIDPIVLTNQDLDEAHTGDGTTLPFEDATFDIVYSDWTVEHVEDPIPFLKQVRRVLKPGGFFFIRTTNRTHYVTLISGHTPQWFHRLVANRVRGMRPDSHDPWKTVYRLNTAATIRRNLVEAGFDQIELGQIEPEPSYLFFNPFAFRLGVLYERLVNRSRRLSRFRLILIVRCRVAVAPSLLN